MNVILLMYNSFLLFIITLVCAGISDAASPVLSFSDIISGPKSGLGDGLGEGAIVTVWGNNLGASRENSKVYFKDLSGHQYAVAYIYYWKNADGLLPGGPSNLYAYQNMQEIAFSIPSAIVDGAGKIYVEVNGVFSNELEFFARSTGRFYFLAQNGSDDNDGSFNSPRYSIATILNGATGFGEGDICYVKSSYHYSAGYVFYGRSGGVVGNSNNEIALVTYPNSSCKVTATENRAPLTNFNGYNHYWVFSKLETQGHYGGIMGNAHGRIIGNNLHGDGGFFYGSSALVDAGYGYISALKVLGNEIHDSGEPDSKFSHATYFKVRNDVDGYFAPEIAWNYVHDNEARYGIHYYDEGSIVGGTAPGSFSDTLKIHHNVVKNQYGPGINFGVVGTDDPQFNVYFDVDVWNNLLINNGLWSQYTNQAYAMHYYGARVKGRIRVFNNTIYGYGDTNRPSSSAGIGTTSLTCPFEFINNIIVDTKNFPFVVSFIEPDAISNNIWHSAYGRMPPTVEVNPITVDPLFAEPSKNNFSLQKNSPAIDAGASVVTSVVKNDLFGNLRPVKGREVGFAQYDIGAIEYYDISMPIHVPFTPSGLRVTLSFQ